MEHYTGLYQKKRKKADAQHVHDGEKHLPNIYKKILFSVALENVTRIYFFLNVI